MKIIELKDITKKFGEHIVFDDYSLSINEGDFVAIKGVSGSGKTTLLNIIGMLIKVDKGDIWIKGYKNPVFGSGKSKKLLRNDVSYLFQNFGLIDDETVEGNLELALHFKSISKKEKKDLMKKTLKEVGLENYENKKIYTLSGGEQQRIAFAKILLKDTSIILADEPTGSLDSYNRDIIMKLFDKLHKKGKTIIVVTHDNYVAECADILVEL